jgi:lysophospholipase L1-like esterase
MLCGGGALSKNFMRLTSLVVLGSLLVWVYLIFQMQHAEFWKSQIAAFEKSDNLHPPKAGAIVLTGSSSVRYWKTLDNDMAPLPVINRGFGGAHISHVNEYVERIVIAYKPQAVVLYAGENDLGWPSKRTPETVCEDFKRFVQTVQTRSPGTRIYFVSIKLSPFRRGRWTRIQAANRLIKEFASAAQGVTFLDVTTPMLEANGAPRAELMPWYRLHMTPKGYELWTSIIKSVLTRDSVVPTRNDQRP